MLGVDAPHAVLDATVSDGVREEAVRRKADLIILGRGRAQGTFRILSHVYPSFVNPPAGSQHLRPVAPSPFGSITDDWERGLADDCERCAPMPLSLLRKRPRPTMRRSAS